jgi:pyridoxal phosphate enzyme (YggS family)
MSDDGGIAERVAAVRERIAEACRTAGRSPSEVTLIAVSKGHPIAAVTEGAAAGLTDFGENFVQELEAKRAAAPDARWHFLGRIQSNKARRIAAADVIHGLEPGEGARRLAAAGTSSGTPVRALLEVDFTGRRQGVPPHEVPAALDGLRSVPGLVLEGLMTVAPFDSSEPRGWFARLRELRDIHAPDLRELSMGMSDDFPGAVEEGATMVRIGTALFGARPVKET